MQHSRTRFLESVAFTMLALAMTSGKTGVPSGDGAAALEARIAELRASGHYGDAIKPARRLLESRRKEGARDFEIADAGRLVKTIERAAALDSKSQLELAEADRLAPRIDDPVGACDAPERVRLADRQLEIRRRLLGQDHEDVAKSLHELARWTSEAGDNERADSLYRAALAIRRQVLGPDHPLVATTMQALAADLAGSRSSEAESLYIEVARIRDQVYGPVDHPERAKTLILAATLAWAKGDYAGAEQPLAQSVTMRRHVFGEEHPDVIESVAGLAAARLQVGDMASAEALNRHALTLQRRFFAAAPCKLTDTLYNMAHILREQGDQREAKLYASEAIDIVRRLNPNDPKLEQYSNLLGLIEYDLDNIPQSVALFEEAMEMERQRLGPGRPTLLQANLAMALTVTPHVGQADSILTAVLTEAQKDPEKYDRLITAALEYQSACADRLGQYKRAEELQVQALERSLKRTGEAHFRINTLCQRLAQYRIAQGDVAGSEEYLSRAARSFELARVKAGAGMKPATFSKAPYEYRALTRLELGRGAEAWADIERARARVLSEAVVTDSIPFALDRIQRVLEPGTAIVGWVDLQLRFSNPLMTRSWGYVIRDSGPVHWERLPRSQDLTTKAVTRQFHAFRNRIAARGVSALGATSHPVTWDEARVLWSERFAPLEKHLKGVRHVVIISSGATAGLPVEILMAPDGHLLADRYAVSYAPSASLHAWMVEHERHDQATPRAALLVGDPPFRAEHLAVVSVQRGAAEEQGAEDSIVVRGAVRGDHASLALLPRLRWSRVETMEAAHILPQPTILLGAAASEPSLDSLASSGALQHFDVIHFATHALVDNFKPERSSLVLSQVGLAEVGPEERPRYDGVVTAAEIASRWKLDADLVTLSACETALGREVFGEGMVGFAYPLMQAGARCVLASLWTVDDEATAQLMKRFYANWVGQGTAVENGQKGRMSKSEALQEAKSWIRTVRDERGTQRFADPYYWSGFVLIGD